MIKLFSSLSFGPPSLSLSANTYLAYNTQMLGDVNCNVTLQYPATRSGGCLKYESLIGRISPVISVLALVLSQSQRHTLRHDSLNVLGTFLVEPLEIWLSSCSSLYMHSHAPLSDKKPQRTFFDREKRFHSITSSQAVKHFGCKRLAGECMRSASWNVEQKCRILPKSKIHEEV